MFIKKLKLGLLATRPLTLTASVIPVTLGAVFAMKEVAFQWVYFILSILAIISLQASANLLNDYYDYISKVDTKDSYGSSGSITKGWFTPRSVLISGYVLLVIGLLLGVFMAFEKGLPVLILGVIGALSAYFYTGKPLELKYKGLGIPLVFIVFGPLMVMGSYYVQSQKFSLPVIIVSIPVGLLTTAILHANDIRDIYHDQKAGIKTLSIIVGESNSHKIYNAFLLIAYVSILLMAFSRIIPYWGLICLITIPTAIKCIQSLRVSESKGTGLIAFDQDTAKLGVQFGSVFIFSLLLPNIIR